MRLLALDPGTRYYGFALYSNAQLVNCGLYDQVMHWAGIDVVVIEMPQYDARTIKVRVKDILDLSYSAGVLAGSACAGKIRKVTPSEWKGSVPKDVMAERITKRLSKEERAMLDEGIKTVKLGLRHNCVDAVGIGLYALGRL